jgi:hypothetical protein
VEKDRVCCRHHAPLERAGERAREMASDKLQWHSLKVAAYADSG